MLDELNKIRKLLSDFERFDESFEKIFCDEMWDKEKKLKGLFVNMKDMHKKCLELIERLEELEKDEIKARNDAKRAEREADEKYKSKYDELEKLLIKNSNVRKSLEDKKVRKQKKFTVESFTMGKIVELSSMYSRTKIIETSIKENLENPEFGIKEYKASGEKKEQLVVRIDVKLDEKLGERCKELGIKRNAFLEIALRQTYREYFEEA